MKLAVVIIGHNQSASITPMLDRLAKLDGDRYWVLDRCKDESAGILASLGERVIVNEEGEGFLAGRMRDLGISAVLESDYDAVLFLDGDRVPTKAVKQSSITKALRRFDVALCLLENDKRPVRPLQTIKEFDPGYFISCGFLIKTELLEIIRQLPVMNGRCFHRDFDGTYGYEDCFLGKILRELQAHIGWADITVSGAIVFDDIQKMQALRTQHIKYDLMCRQLSLVVE